MILFQLVTLLHQLEDQRVIMHNLAEKKGLLAPEVLKVSQKIDVLVNNYQKLLPLLPKS
ncbi:aspartyl-phosphate phosphatase Spo0E family protein [Ammoniphilus sp. 3BR4]|uniref:aspartyl-phosphate phosphatase Spo0E family protein n=1 Tax=Ammoniphilus sp. 3BR4 TaxID=3158265 RepID=UPI0034651984